MGDSRGNGGAVLYCAADWAPGVSSHTTCAVESHRTPQNVSSQGPCPLEGASRSGRAITAQPYGAVDSNEEASPRRSTYFLAAGLAGEGSGRGGDSSAAAAVEIRTCSSARGSRG